MPKVNIKDLYGKTGDASKPVANIPTGVWKLRAIKISAKPVTKTNSEGEEYETTEFLTSLEPLEPGSNVNPDELNELDESTGKPVYEGKRLFLRSTLAFRNEMRLFDDMTSAMGIPLGTPIGEIVENNMVKGRTARGEIFNRSYVKNDGTPGVEQKVRSWAQPEQTGFVL